MKRLILLSAALLFTACREERVTVQNYADSSQSSSAMLVSSSAGASFSSLDQKTLSDDMDSICEIIDAGLPIESWHVLEDKAMGFVMKYPGFIHGRLSHSIDLINYRCRYERQGLDPGQYYIAIRTLQSMGFEDCGKSMRRVILSSEQVAFRDEGPRFPRGKTFTLCFNEPIGLYFAGTENSDSGELINSILDTVKILPRSSETE